MTLDPEQTAALLPCAPLVAALREAVLGLARQQIASPARQVVPMANGGLLLSMLATGPDLCIHKLVSVVPGNRAQGLPTIQGRVQVLEAATGAFRLSMDGATVTGRRTAVMSVLGTASMHPEPPHTVLLVGTGLQAAQHAAAFRATYPGVRLEVVGRTLDAARRFAAEHSAGGPIVALANPAESRAQVVVTCTTSRQPVYDLPADPSRLLVAVGSFSPAAAEIGAATVQASHCVVDDPEGARHEAGDLILAGKGWDTVQSLAAVIESGRPPAAPVLFKTVGCAAWDMAAARVALARLPDSGF